MQIIAISCGSQSYGAEFASKLAANLGHRCVGRDEIVEEATRQRIAIGRLETAIVKPHTFTGGLALELEHYKALATSMICERALQGGLVYYGRAGHLLLPGIDHVLKIRVIADVESRIDSVVRRLGLSRDRARQYVEQLDEDRKRWVRQFYHVDWDASSHHDLTLNLSGMNVGNAATAVCALAQLPEFQVTPAITRSLQDLHLASRSRLLLASDKRTSALNVRVRATDGVVHVTYLDYGPENAQRISEVLSELKDIRETVCTAAQTNILWVQEAFEAGDDAYNDVLRLANTWDAAVELVQMSPSDTVEEVSREAAGEDRGTESWRETGIMEDEVRTEGPESEGMTEVYEKLVSDGHAGGKRSISGSLKTLLNAVDRSTSYRLIVLDRMFSSKGHAARIRLMREWANTIGDSLRVPVLSVEEIRSRYRFGLREYVRMLLCAALSAIVVLLIFEYDSQIYALLSRTGTGWRMLATLSVFVFVPLFALIYSTATDLFLKMMKVE